MLNPASHIARGPRIAAAAAATLLGCLAAALLGCPRAEATEAIAVRTVRPAVVEMHRAANGIPTVTESSSAPPMRTKVTVRRSSGLEGIQPRGCFDSHLNYVPHYDCGSRSVRDGIYLSPLANGRHWYGFTVEPRSVPAEQFENCPLTAAQEKLPLDLSLDMVAVASRLISHKLPKIVFEDTGLTFNANSDDQGTVSIANGELGYRLKLVRTGMPAA